MKKLLDKLNVERLEFYANNEPPFGYTGSDIQNMARVALAVKQAQPVLSSLKRYDLDMDGCDSCGQDCGADMSEDPDGEFVLFADVVALLASAQKPVAYTSADALDDVACGLTAMMGPNNAVGSIPLYTNSRPEGDE